MTCCANLNGCGLVQFKCEIHERLTGMVQRLSTEMPSRNAMNPETLRRARDFICRSFDPQYFDVQLQTFPCRVGKKQIPVSNVIARHKNNRPDKGKSIVVGAHYDSVDGAGADDNASGVAALTTLSERIHDLQSCHNIELVCFVNEEPPFYQSNEMGSFVYTQNLRRRGVPVHIALILDMVGYFSSHAGSQDCPDPSWGRLPSAGDFLFGWADPAAEFCLKDLKAGMDTGNAPLLSVARHFPGDQISAVVNSDTWSFWKYRYPAVLLTDTAFFRNKNYHTQTDTYETLDYPMMANIVRGLQTFLASTGERKIF